MSRQVIDSFTGKYAFLSNFFPARITSKKARIIYPTSEHAFQALKSLNLTVRRVIALCPTPGDAKRAGRVVPLRPNWDYIKRNVMLKVLRAKFKQNPELAELLLTTGDSILIEGNHWGDTYWGVYKGQGTNWLGILLMQVRKELIDARANCK